MKELAAKDLQPGMKIEARYGPAVIHRNTLANMGLRRIVFEDGQIMFCPGNHMILVIEEG